MYHLPSVYVVTDTALLVAFPALLVACTVIVYVVLSSRLLRVPLVVVRPLTLSLPPLVYEAVVVYERK